MNMSPKRLFFILLILFSTISFIKLLITSSSLPTRFPQPARRITRDSSQNTTVTKLEEDPLTPNEYSLLKNLITKRAPSSLLFFGLNPQYLKLAKLNTAGTTAFLEDDARRTRTREFKEVKVYFVEYRDAASEAYSLLSYARASPACKRPNLPLTKTRCKLALTELPKAVLEVKWDVIVVDGPSSARPEEPGRMGAIYTAAMMARSGNVTDVLIHNADRTIEKWYAWEFLCDENLVASKGRLWHFRIQGGSSSATLCSHAAIKIQ